MGDKHYDSDEKDLNVLNNSVDTVSGTDKEGI